MDIKDISFGVAIEKALKKSMNELNLEEPKLDLLKNLINKRKEDTGLITSLEDQLLSLSCFEKNFDINISILINQIYSFDFIKDLKNLLGDDELFFYSFRCNITKILNIVLNLRKGNITEIELIDIINTKGRWNYVEGVLIKDIDFKNLKNKQEKSTDSYCFCIFENCNFSETIYFDNLEHCIFKNCTFPIMSSFKTGTCVDITFSDTQLNSVNFEDLFVDFITFKNCNLDNVYLPNAFEEISFWNSEISNSKFVESKTLYNILIKNSKHDFELKKIDQDLFNMMYKDSNKFKYLKNKNFLYSKLGNEHYLVKQEDFETWRFHKIDKDFLNEIMVMVQ